MFDFDDIFEIIVKILLIVIELCLASLGVWVVIFFFKNGFTM